MLFEFAIDLIVCLAVPFMWVWAWFKWSQGWMKGWLRSQMIQWRLRNTDEPYRQMVTLRLVRMYLRGIPQTQAVIALQAWCAFEIKKRRLVTR